MQIENLITVKKGYNTDKLENRMYLERYDKHFLPLRNKNIRLLELGVKKGGSLLLWKDYFEKSKIAGLDFDAITIDLPEDVFLFQGLQQDFKLLDSIADQVAPEGFDIIIDDCSHIGEITKMSFWNLFDKHLKPGGIFVIEDWGTGYWGGYADGKKYLRWRGKRKFSITQQLLQTINAKGSSSNFVRFMSKKLSSRKLKSHQYGMVGFVKQLIDECALEDITHPEFGTKPSLISSIADIHISLGQVFVYKK